MEATRYTQDDLLSISIWISDAYVKRVIVDTGKSIDVLYANAFQKLRLTKCDLHPMVSSLTRFTTDSISPLGMVTLYVTFKEEPYTKTLPTKFVVVDAHSNDNVIIERSTLDRLKAMVLTYHLMIKFPTSWGFQRGKKQLLGA